MAATIAERRRLERDLHDGAQQRLIATGMRLRTIQRDLDPARSAEIDRAVAELEGTVGELRQLAHGVRPSRLDDGLGPALEAVRAAAPIPVDVQVSPLPVFDEVRVPRGSGSASARRQGSCVSRSAMTESEESPSTGR